MRKLYMITNVHVLLTSTDYYRFCINSNVLRYNSRMVEVVKLQLNFPVFMNSRIDIKVLCFMPATNISS